MAVYVTRDGERVSPPLGDADAAAWWLQRHQPMSNDWATKHEGYAVTPDDGQDPLITVAEVAASIGWKPESWRSAVASGRVPRPDDPDDADGRHPRRRTPRWRVSTVRRWQVSRPGPGARTDMDR